MIPTREQLVRDLERAKEQSIRKWTEIVEVGHSYESCGYCGFFGNYNTVLKGIDGHICRVCPVDPRGVESACFPEYDAWYEKASKEHAQAVLDIIHAVDVEDFVNKLLEAEDTK